MTVCLEFFFLCLVCFSNNSFLVVGFQPNLRHRSAKITTVCRSSRGILEEAFTTSRSKNEEGLVSSSNVDVHLAFPGGGIMFYWQAGVITYLRENGYDLSSCSFAGASAGALTATFASTEVCFYDATELALKLAGDAGVWDRRGGLANIWGPMIEEWLDVLLPKSIEGVDGRLSLLVTPVPSFGKTKVDEFTNRDDLIRCNMASVHLPWFLDGKLVSNFRNSPHIDGSFLSKPVDFIPESVQPREVLLLDWTEDPILGSKRNLEVVEALSPEGIWGLLDQGKTYAKEMEERGIFSCLTKTK